jgi:hypothetical protein
MDQGMKDAWQKRIPPIEGIGGNDDVGKTNRQALEDRALDKGATIAPGYANNEMDIVVAIRDAVEKNHGPFRRIIIIGHAGATGNEEQVRNDKFTPSIKLRKRRLHSGNISPQFKQAIKGGLIKGGVLILGSCGHAGDDFPGWLARLKEWAKELQCDVGGNPEEAAIDPVQGTTGIIGNIIASPDGTVDFPPTD